MGNILNSLKDSSNNCVGLVLVMILTCISLYSHNLIQSGNNSIQLLEYPIDPINGGDDGGHGPRRNLRIT